MPAITHRRSATWSQDLEARLEHVWLHGWEIEDICRDIDKSQGAVYLKVKRLGLPRRVRVDGDLVPVYERRPADVTAPVRSTAETRICLSCGRKFPKEKGIFICDRCKATEEWQNGGHGSSGRVVGLSGF